MYENPHDPLEPNGKPLALDRSLAEQHVRLLTDDPNTHVCFCASDTAGNTTEFFGTVFDKWPEIERLQGEGCEIYLAVNEGGNRDAEITSVRSLFVDADGVPPPNSWHAGPDFFVRCDETHWHAYWRVADLPVDEFADAQQRLAAYYGTNQKLCNGSPQMPLAGTLQFEEPADPHLVTIDNRSLSTGPNCPFFPWRREKDLVLAGLPSIPIEVQQARQGDLAASEAPKPLKQDFTIHWPGEDMTPTVFWDEHGMLPRSPDGAVAILYGDWGTHKTNTVLTLLFDAVDKGARAVYAAGEGFRNVCAVRVPAHCKARGINATSLHNRLALIDRVPLLTDPEEVKAFIDVIRVINPHIIVLDTLATATAGLDENGSTMSSLLTGNGAVGQLRREFAALVILIGHEGKTGGKGVRGHSGLMGNADAALRLSSKGEMIDIAVVKMRDGPDGHHAHFNIEMVDGVPVPCRATGIPRRTTNITYDLLYQHLSEHDCHGEDAGVPRATLAAWIDPDDAAKVEAKLKNMERQPRSGRSIGPCEALRARMKDGWLWFIPKSSG
jgi:hypothetical protein